MANPFDGEMEDDKKDLQLFTKGTKEISYADVASKLINDNLLLTALELHTELIEAGREVSKLKEFFSNPGNFEQASATRLDSSTSSIPRSSSQVTLDSLDLTRYSEDGERGTDERVAVLEFELRKARETISGLRADLTVVAQSPDVATESVGEAIRPHEQRAINFLLNEYLLLHGYKLTSITFGDENEDQDFEDWDDVGLNIPKPAELLSLYRDYTRHSGHARSPGQDASCQTDFSEEPESEARHSVSEEQHSESEAQHLESEVQHSESEARHSELLEEIERLKERVTSLDRQRAWTDDTPTPGDSELGAVGVHEATSTHSATPERFELIDAESKMADDGSASLVDTDNEWTRVVLPTGEREGGTTVTSESPSPEATLPSVLLHSPTSRALPASFQLEVFARCFVNTARQHEKHLLDDILQEEITEHRLVYILGQSLPRIIPNIILNKREEVLPLVVSTIRLHPEAAERDRLLHLLFNLRKRPAEDERLAILAGVVCIARRSGPSLVENEILPQCWEQIAHRHVERRLLVAEACSALAPYISSPIRNSLMLSMLQQMLVEDKSEIVRETAVRSLALIVALVDDDDKYPQCESLATGALDDPAPAVVTSALRLLLPVVARWAMDLGRLASHLLPGLVERPPALACLVPYLVVWAAGATPGTPDADTRPRSTPVGRGLTSPEVFYEGEFPVAIVMGAFDAYVRREGYEDWPEMRWTFDTFLPSLLDAVQRADETQEAVVAAFVQLFRELTVGFGEAVSRSRIRPRFADRLQALEKNLAASRGTDEAKPSLAIIPVYLVGVLASSTQGECSELGPTLKRFLFGLPLCGAPLTVLRTTVRGLCQRPVDRDTVLSALWDAVVHPRPIVRRSAAALLVDTLGDVGEALLVAKVVPALVTLASDPDISVRVATVPAFGALITHTTQKEVHDKTYMQLQSFLSDPASRDDHGMLLQLVTTMGQVVTSVEPWFREEVILPQLAAMAAYTLQLSNLTKRLDLTNVLIEAFSNAVYCTLSRQTVSTALLPGLRYLEPITCQSLQVHHDTVLTMIRSAESRIESGRPVERAGSSVGANVGQGMEDMKKKVSNIFANKSGLNRPANLPNIFTTNKPVLNRPANLPNLQSIFRKK